MRIRLTDLSPGVNYALQLQSDTGDAVSAWSRIFYLLTTSDTVAPSMPTGATGTMSGTSFKLTWNVVTTSSDGNLAYDLDHYEVLVSSTGSGITRTYWTVDTQFEVTLERNIAIFGSAQANIQMQVRAVDKVGNASSYTTLSSQTNPAPATPTGLVVTPGVDSINIKWNEVTDLDLKYYEVRVSTTGSSGTYNKVYAGMATSYVHPTVAYGVDHWIRVYAMDVFNTYSSALQSGSAVRPLSTATIDSVAPAVPTGLAATMSVTADAARASAAVSWTAVTDTDGDLAGYEIGYKPSSAADYQYTTVDYLTTATRIDGLIPYVNYSFIIRSYDWAANYSAWSSVATGTGNTNVAPSTPATPSAAVAGQSIQVSHDNTKSGGGAMEGDVIYYEVYASTTTGFTPGTSNMLGTMPVGPAIIGQWDVSPSNSSGTTQTWYVKVIAVDRGGLKSSASAQATASPNLILTANIGDLQVTDAKINTLAVNKLTAGTGIINDLTVKAKLTLGDASTVGSIESYGYVAATTGFHFDKNLLEINQGSIAAAALKIQNGNNMMPPQYADFEHTDYYYVDPAYNTRGQGMMYVVGTGKAEALYQVGSLDVPKFGKQFLSVSTLGGTNSITAYMGLSSSDYNINVEPGRQYIVSAYVRSWLTSAQPDWQLVVKGDDGTDLATATINLGAGALSAAYTRYQTVVTIPGSGVSKVLVRFRNITSTYAKEIHIDGVQLEPVEGGLTQASSWKPPASTTISPSGISTGYLRSSGDITVSGTTQPLWSINMAGNMQIGDVIVRGKVVVGTGSEALPNRAPNSGNFETNVTGYSVYQVGATTPAIVRTTTVGEVITGTGSAKVTAAAGTKTSLGLSYATPMTYLPGTTVVVNANVKSNTSDGTIVIEFLNSSAAVVQTTTVRATVVAGTTYAVSASRAIPTSTDVASIRIYQTGTITVTSFIVDDIYMTANNEIGVSFVSSANYISGSTGWKIDGQGNVEFNNGVYRGSLGAGTIDGMIITGATLQTSASGERITIEGGTGTTDNEITFYAPSGAKARLRSNNPIGTPANAGVIFQGNRIAYGGNLQNPQMILYDDGSAMFGRVYGDAATLDSGDWFDPITYINFYESSTPTAGTQWVEMKGHRYYIEYNGDVRGFTASLQLEDGGIETDGMRSVEGVYSDSTPVNVTSTTGASIGARGGEAVFYAPPSGVVTVAVSALLKAPADGTRIATGFEIRTGTTIGSGTVVSAYSADGGAEAYNLQYQTGTALKQVTGLTAGAAYNVRQITSVASGTGSIARGRVTVRKEM